MRLFAALPLPRPAVEAIRQSIAAVRKERPRLRWVSEQAYHVTLHFFGEVEEEAVDGLRRVFEDPRLKRSVLVVRFGPIGQFPTGGTPRVVWIALSEEGGELRSYWELFESAVAPLGWMPDRRGFTPHVTLARNPGLHLPQEWDSAVTSPELQFAITECVLFQSILGRGGSEYVRLKSVPFDGGTT